MAFTLSFSPLSIVLAIAALISSYLDSGLARRMSITGSSWLASFGSGRANGLVSLMVTLACLGLTFVLALAFSVAMGSDFFSLNRIARDAHNITRSPRATTKVSESM